MILFASNVVAGTVLVRSAIQSPNYVAGVSGWTVNQDGSVEFNNAVIRGSIIAGGGKVRLDSGGVKVDGTIYQYDINFTGGFLARRIPDDGGYVQMNMLVADGYSGGGIFMNPTDPTPNGNTYSSAGQIYSSTVAVGTVDAGFTGLRSPSLTGKGNSSIFLYGENTDSTVAPRLSINGNVAMHEDLIVEGLTIFGSAATAPIGSDDSSVTVGTTTSTTFVTSLAVAGVRGVAFTAPPSGKVQIFGSTGGYNNTAGQYTLVDFVIQAGAVVGAGAFFRNADENTASQFQSAVVNQAGQHSVSAIVTGLTPGSVYNASLAYRVTANTGQFNRRRIYVNPLGF